MVLSFLKKWWPLFLFASFGLGFYFSPLGGYCTLTYVREVQADARNWVALHPIYSALIFIAVYIGYLCTLLPGINFFDVVAGFLFLQPVSTLLVALSALSGGMLIFALFKLLIREVDLSRFSSLEKMKKGVERSEGSYMLFLRLAPFFPFSVVSAASAFLRVSTKTFIWTTLVGVVPVAFLYTQAGSGLGEILEGTDPITMGQVFNKELIIALVGLCIFSCLPIFLLRIKVKRERE